MKFAKYYKKYIPSNYLMLRLLESIRDRLSYRQLNEPLSLINNQHEYYNLIIKLFSSFKLLGISHLSINILTDLIDMIVNEIKYCDNGQNSPKYIKKYSGKKAIIKNLYKYGMLQIVEVYRG